MADAAPRVVRLTRLALTNFRNYSAARFDAEASHIVFAGPNGAGKTNLLEAISLLSPGRGLRRATYAQMARQDAGPETGWTIHARVTKDGEESAIGTGFTPFTTSRTVRIDGEDARPDDLSERMRILWLTPAMDGLFTGAAADRRRFIDRLALALFPAHGRRANAYDRAMRQRNRMFEDGVFDAKWFAAVEREMAEHAAAISQARFELIAKLNAAQAVRAAASRDFPQAVVSVVGDVGEAHERRFADFLEKVRERDRAAGRAITGPHRADLEVIHVEKNMPAALASTGEQKALLIGIILGHAALVTRMVGETPVLLLDEVAAHLDPGRRAALYDTLDALGAQTFMTGTDQSLFTALGDRADRFHVEGGKVAPVTGLG
ncbi:DNA replication/repair protein RecF [Acuticoccus kandeliae]|uniref:DNA replication/repair protein RecF n=1 Tax=Acuticoccus kandeliae TaxID=2073160 RepID=UPI000D3E36F7|nr:DNA replication/repair protein RecF [Acuticoccus kandeliae]